MRLAPSRYLCLIAIASSASAFSPASRLASSLVHARASISHPGLIPRGTNVNMMPIDPAEAKKAAMAKKKEAAAKAAADKADASDNAEEETEEEKAARLAEEKAQAEAEAKKKAEEAAKKAAEAAKKKAAAEAKAAAQKAEAVACFSQADLVLAGTAGLNPAPATVNERADYLRAQGLDEANIQAAMTEVGAKEVEYMRDAWGRIVALNGIDYNPNSKPPPANAFGQQQG